MFYHGEGGKAVDHAEAVKWWQKAAEQGHPDAEQAAGRPLIGREDTAYLHYVAALDKVDA